MSLLLLSQFLLSKCDATRSQCMFMHPGATHYKAVRIQGRHHSAQQRLPTQTASHCPRWRRLRHDRHYRESPSQRQVVLELGITWLPASVLEKEFYDTAWIPTTVQMPGDNLLIMITGSTFPEIVSQCTRSRLQQAERMCLDKHTSWWLSPLSTPPTS